MTMTKKFKIVCKYIKDLSSETPDIETYLFVRDQIQKYQLGIEINSKALKNKMIEVNTKLTYQDKEIKKKETFFQIVYATVIKIDDSVDNKDELKKIVLCDVQKDIYPKLERIFLDIIKRSGFPNIKFTKQVNFEELYKNQIN